METTTPGQVVVAVGSRGSAAAVEHAAREAVRRDCPLHLVHAVERPELEAEGAATLETAASLAARLVADPTRVTAGLVRSPAVAAVTTTAANAALVVVGRCAASARTHPYVRSVTGGVAARTHAPVVSVPDGWRPEAVPPHVVVGVDDPGTSGVVLREAFAAARSRQARLTVLTAWWRPSGATDHALTHVDDAARTAACRAELDLALVDLVDAYADVPVEVHVRNDRPGEVLVRASYDAELVVVGRHDPLLPVGSYVGPVARSVLRESVCPVLLTAPDASHHVVRREHAVPV